MTEPDVALTDFALSLESTVFAAVLWRNRRYADPMVRWFAAYFVTAGVASLCGGLVHGFFLEANTLGNAILWPATLLSIGLNAVTAMVIGARLLFPPIVARWVAGAAGLGMLVLIGVVISGFNSFRVAVWMAVPAAIFLLGALLVAYRREGRAGALFAAGGLALTLAAMAVQQAGIGFHPRFFNHNAVAHVVQAIALAMFFVGSLRLLDLTSTNTRARAACTHAANS